MQDNNPNINPGIKKVLTFNDLRNGEHWFTANEYRQNEIEAIKDPEGGIGDQPSSIPSPFAQMDLVKTAFKNIANRAEKETSTDGFIKTFDGLTSDHKLISNCFDVGEIFFNLEKLQDQIKIVSWDKNEDINKLKNSSDQGHKKLADVFNLYLEQDKNSFNFDAMQNLFFLKYENDSSKIIGATSPVTLFFASPNPLDFIKIKLTHSDYFFNGNPLPLYSRNAEYQLFLYALSYAINDFSLKFKAVFKYLEINKKILERINPKLYQDINNLDTAFYYEKYAQIQDPTGSQVNILGVPLLTDRGNPNQSSDFKIRRQKDSIGSNPTPLILVRDHSGKTSRGKSMRYWGNRLFDLDIKQSIPYCVDEPLLTERILPGGVGAKYPFLTVNDLLEEHLVRLKYPLNSEYFYSYTDSKGKDKKKNGYLLPIKEKFFEYFQPSFLKDTVSGKPVFEMREVGIKNIEVQLRIPLEIGEYIELKRVYYDKGQKNSGSSYLNDNSSEDNDGSIIEPPINLSIFPFVRFNTEIKPDYRIQFIDRDNSGIYFKKDYTLKFWDESSNSFLQAIPKYRSIKNKDIASTSFFVIEHNFDFIQIINDEVKAIIIPDFSKAPTGDGTDEFRFAIDFGTTNTHIEYNSASDLKLRPFEFTSQENAVISLYQPEKQTEQSNTDPMLHRFVNQEFLPHYIGGNTEFSFPFRTVVSESASLNFTASTKALIDINIPFTYEKIYHFMNSRMVPNLKWSNYSTNGQQSNESQKRIEAFFEEIMLLIRAKIMINGGNLYKTQLIWFYPSSMMEGRRDKLEAVWNSCFKKYINPNYSGNSQNSKSEYSSESKITKMSESIAPFYYYKEKGSVKAKERPVVSVDIGGGTTDVVIFMDNSPSLLTSFKFAANSIFGDGFSKTPSAENNGFCNKYHDLIKEKIEAADVQELMDIFNKTNESKVSEEIISFYFSLANNDMLKKKQIEIHFGKLLADDGNLKFIFVIFYIAIMYHIVNLMKVKGLDLPRYMTFSGTGSKLLNILSPRIQTLEEVTKIIFEKIYGREFDRDGFEIKTNEHPKEITCKGGLLSMSTKEERNIENLKEILVGAGELLQSTSAITYKELESNSHIVEQVAKSVEDFNKFVKDLNKIFNFSKKLDMAPCLETYMDEMDRDIKENIKQGIEDKKEELGKEVNSQPVEESLFFYHFIEALHKAAAKLANQ